MTAPPRLGEDMLNIRRHPSPEIGLPVPRDRRATLTTVLCVTAGFVGATASGHPTIFPLLDVVLRFALAAGVTLAASCARRRWVLLLAGIAAAASPELGVGLAGFGALTLAGVASVRATMAPWLGALVGLLATTALLRLPSVGGHGTTAAIVFAAVLPVASSALRAQDTLIRRRLRRVAAAAGVATAIALVGLGIALLTGGPRAEAGTRSARAGIQLAKEGDAEAAARELGDAVDSFSDANTAMRSPLTWAARALPWVGHQVEALEQVSAIGKDLAVAAADAERKANYRSIPVDDGRIDVALITSFGAPLGDMHVALTGAQAKIEAVDESWLAFPITERLDALRRDVRDASADVDTAARVVAIAPALLGADGPRRYFVAFTTPAETRGLGGFLGSWAELTADGGRLDLTRNGRGVDLGAPYGDESRQLVAPADYLARYGPLRVENEVRDITFSPDFPSVAQAIASVYPQTPGGGQVDGVLLLDPYALAAMLKITGPIMVDGYDSPITADNAADILLRRQYLDFDEDKGARVDFLDEVSRKTFNRFIHSRSLRPAQLAAVFGPLVEQRRVMAWSNRPDEQRVLAHTHLDGAFPYRPPPNRLHADGPAETDFFALATNNAGNNKIDIYLHRQVQYTVDYDPASGSIAATATLTLRNDAPGSGLPEYVIKNRKDSGQPPGTNWMWLNVYSPHQLTTASTNGDPLPLRAGTELGLNVYDVFVAVPPGGETTIVLNLRGFVSAGATYRLSSYAQPVVNPDQVTVRIRPPAPWHGPSLPAGEPVHVAVEPGHPARAEVHFSTG